MLIFSIDLVQKKWNFPDCICHEYFYEDPESDLCVPKASGGACVSTDDCRMAGDPHTVCIEKKCCCLSGYILHHGQCKEINCNVTLDCHVFDKNWECQGGKCIDLSEAQLVYLNVAGLEWLAITLLVVASLAILGTLAVCLYSMIRNYR